MKVILLVGAIFLSGCASQIMDGYVGKDVSNAVLDYGPPFHVMDLPDGQRAFQWKMTSVGSVPTTTTVNATAYGNSVYGTATTYGGGVYSQTCLYTLIGAKNGQGSYTVTGFRAPSLMCE